MYTGIDCLAMDGHVGRCDGGDNEDLDGDRMELTRTSFFLISKALFISLQLLQLA